MGRLARQMEQKKRMENGGLRVGTMVGRVWEEPGTSIKIPQQLILKCIFWAHSPAIVSQ